MAKKLVGFFSADRDLPVEEYADALINAVMQRLEEMGVFDGDDPQDKNKEQDD